MVKVVEEFISVIDRKSHKGLVMRQSAGPVSVVDSVSRLAFGSSQV